MKKIGFCKQCMRNVPHVLYFSWPVFRYLNQHLEFANSLPMGSWHCCGCERNSFTIKRPDPEVTTDITSTTMNDIVDWPDRNDRSQRTGLLFHRKRKSAAKQTGETTEEPDVEFEHVGNVTRGDDSLLVRKARAARYSKKFRESVVERILTGKSTISQLRNELDLSERDLLDWVNEKVVMQGRQIKKLSQVVDAVKHLAIEELPSDARQDSRPRVYEDAGDYQSKASGRPHDGKTIDGRVNHG